LFKGLGNLASMLKQAQQISGRMQELSDELKSKRAVGTAGGDLVQVEVNGLSEVLRCRIDPSLVQQGDTELLEDLVTAAVNQALGKVKDLNAEAMKSLAGKIDLPGLEDALGKLTEGSA
jgi:DNA-binding YbaB/EbfC family protein